MELFTLTLSSRQNAHYKLSWKLPSDSKIAALFFLSALTYDEKQIHNDKLTSELTQKMKHSNFEEKLSIMDRLKQICENYHLRWITKA